MTSRFQLERRIPRFAVRNVRRAALLLSLLAVCAGPAAAETRLYTLEIPEDRAVTYELPLEVRHPGLLTIRAEWDGPRQLSLRVDRPDNPVAVARRVGLSPQLLEIEVPPDSAGPANWQLAIHSLAAAGSGEGLLTIELPSPPGEDPPVETPASAPPPAPDPPQWMEPRRAPRGSPPDQLRLFAAGERYRVLLDRSVQSPPPDSCRWQNDLMRYLAERLDSLDDAATLPTVPTRRLLVRIADAVDDVEELRTSNDPLLVGPPPEDRERRELWLKLRREKFQPIEGELDELTELVLRGHAPQLESQDWPMRMVTCLAACERHFEARARTGAEQATNRDLARDQWDRLQAAAAALRALAEFGDPGRGNG